MAITVPCKELGVSTWKHLGLSHLRAVLGLPLNQQRKLMTLAEAKVLTTDELERHVAGDPAPFLEQVDALSPEEAEALFRTVTGVKLKCEDLAAKLAQRATGVGVPGFGEPGGVRVGRQTEAAAREPAVTIDLQEDKPVRSPLPLRR